jgi:CRP/FNR family transcriptional regulator, cyclic AMP receptor protein
MKTINDILSEHSFFQGLSSEDLSFISGCGKNVIFQEQQVIANPGDSADEFYLIRDGLIAITLETLLHKPFVFQTLSTNEIVGLSWLIPPYQWTVSAHAVQRTRAIAINGSCLRDKCERDPRLGFKLMKQLVKELVKREDAIRLHLLDVYGNANK